MYSIVIGSFVKPVALEVKKGNQSLSDALTSKRFGSTYD